MDSSLAVFSTLGSPFLEASGSRSHYHPSQTQPLKQKKQQTVLSPSRLQHRNCSVLPEEAEPLSASSPHLLPDSSSHEGGPPKSNSTSPFNESWPSTERSSSSLTSEGKKDLPAQQSSEAKTLDAQRLPDSASDSESIIAKYIERFRYGKPTDRQKRLASSGGSTEFWWLSHSFLPDGENSKKEASLSSDNSQSEVRSSLFSPILTQTALGEMQAASAFDTETVSLQERAARVISRSISPLSSFRPVSSGGLDSTATSTNPNSTPDLPQHALRHPAAHQIKESLGLPYHTTPSSNIAHSLRPEDDILFQWRLQRKMEEASKAVAAMPPEVWRNLCFHPTCASGKMEREVLKSTEPTPWRDTDQKILSTSEPHLDIKYTQSQCHPCSCAGMLRNEITSGKRIEIVSPSNGTVATGGPECRDEPIVKDPTPQKDHVPDYLETSPSKSAKANESLSQTTSRHVQQGPSDQGMPLELGRRPGLCRDKQSQAKPIPGPRQSTRSPAKNSVQHVLSELPKGFSPHLTLQLFLGTNQREAQGLWVQRRLFQRMLSPLPIPNS
ncbi:proline and serine-rich protein 3 isoform X2 [Ahaetulla prasina]|uniref:proline and serine-rich protein 3 isoform X2 n=1 Tax=Ahaetulla prasina TaxID=499056 RepID=UPI0026477774|nr:proline and serine-rich protein 3 isoform X2 [Ahaetulla prasina]